jgi:hypothetical protein
VAAPPTQPRPPGGAPGFASLAPASPPGTPLAGGGRTPPPGEKACKCGAADGSVPPTHCRSGNCGCRRRGGFCSAACACAAPGHCCAVFLELAGNGGTPQPGTPLTPPGRKQRVHETFPSEDAYDAWQSRYTAFVRDDNIRNSAAVQRRTDRTVCLYSLRPRPWQDLDVEHVIEGQMSGYAIVNCAAAHAFISRRLRQVDTSLPGFVRRSVLQPYFELHNADLNLVFADHNSNMKKKAAVEHALKELSRGRELERGLHGILAARFASGTAAVDADEADACATRVIAALRQTHPAYCGGLEAVSASAPGFVNMEPADRRAAAGVYGDIGEFMGKLCDEGLRLGR